MTIKNSNLLLRAAAAALRLAPPNLQSFAGANMPTQTTKNKIAFVIPRGEVVRNFVHSGTLKRMAERAALELISVEFEAEINRELAEKYGALHPLVEYPERFPVRIAREFLDMAHNRWLWSPASRSRVQRHDQQTAGVSQKLKRVVKKIAARPLANRFCLSALSKIERAASRRLRTSDEYLDLLKKMQPSLVFNGSHVHSRVATQAVQAAQWLKIPTATFIFSWDNLTSQGRIMLPYDYYLVWNDQLKRQLLSIYRNIKSEQVFVTGTPQFDFHFRPEFYQTREEFCRECGLDPEKKTVLYTTGMANHMPGEELIVEEIADLLRETGGGAAQLLVRVYPKDLTGRFEKLKARRPDILFQQTAWEKSWLTPRFEDSYALVNALRHCALGINIASTVSLELCMFDKPVINVGYNPPNLDAKTHRFVDFYDFDHYRPLVASGAVELARSPRQTRDLLAKCLAEPARRSSERQELIEKMFGATLDGKSAERVAETLLKLAEKPPVH